MNDQNHKNTQPHQNTPQNPPQEPQKRPQGWISALALADAYRVTVGTLRRILRACGVPHLKKHLTTPQGSRITRTYYPATLYPRQRRK